MTSKTRRPLVAGNWKMNGLGLGGVALARDVAAGAADAAADVVVCPPFTLLAEVRKALAGTAVEVGAQNIHWEDKGAFTGEISGPMLVEVGCSYVIIGHSERRQYFGETDLTVSKRLAGAVRHGLRPIVCVGETWEEREAGRTEERIGAQLRGALAAPPYPGLSIAYEPVWAIGSGRAASSRDAEQVSAFIRRALNELLGRETAAVTRILYGGSVKPDNMAEFAAQDDVDGALVGGASLDAASFVGIVKQVIR